MVPKLTTAEEQVKRWAEYFEELLNRPALLNAADIQPAEELLQVNIAKPTKDEVRKAIRTLKNGKSAEPDGIPAEALKADLSTSTNMLYEIIENMWEEEEIPKEWKEGYLVKLPKKGNLRECNYRGMMFLSVPGKVLNRIILEMLKMTLNSKLRDHQVGVCQERSCIDQITTLHYN